ncbi:MAG: CBS domain-containing protein [Gammaproteobacteria bacterium]|jgi:signal-transduction protein with cAMP-binding, CBS, and nucleotidyltransferase domain
MRVSEICNRDAAIIGKLDTIPAAAACMRDFHVDYLVVVESVGGINIPVGTMTDRDIVVNLIASNIELDGITVGDVMATPLLLVDEQDSVINTLKRMRHQCCQHVPVVKSNGALSGILSIENIIDMLAEQFNHIGYILNQDEYFSYHHKTA